MWADTTADVDVIWSKFAKDKNPELRGELITVYAPLVRFVVGRLGIPPTSLLEAEDLVSYGMIGLINAIDRFDPSRGVRFEAFASVRIRGAVIDQLRSLNWLPRSAISRVRQIEAALAVLRAEIWTASEGEGSCGSDGCIHGSLSTNLARNECDRPLSGCSARFAVPRR